MNPVALALVLSAAVLHATWNLFAKQVKSGAPFVWLVAALSSLIFAPFVVLLFVFRGIHLGLPQFVFLAGSGCLHIVYFLILQRGYREGDLSLVYPVARGVGPALATAAAILLFGEHPSALTLIGGGLILVGVVTIAGSAPRGDDPAARSKGIGYGIAIGVIIAIYTLWDKRAVSAPFLVPPLVQDYGSSVVRSLVLAPVAWAKRDEVVVEWTQHRRQVIGVALLSPLAYILVLSAMAIAPVSSVAPAREVSILIGVGLGARVLSEGSAVRRLVGALAMLAGIVALARG